MRSRIERMADAWPILFVFVVLAALYSWQVSKHPTPWLFSDEIEYTEISRAIAETGSPARRGVEYWGAGLYPWVTAPFWWIGDIRSAYAAIKDFQALLMAAAAFPTYLLARTLMPRRWALVAAVGAGIAPALVYSRLLIQEPLAYPYAALCFYAIARALATRGRWWIASAVVLTLLGPQMRDQLVLLVAVLGGGAIIVAAQSARVHSSWQRQGWGIRLAAVGLVLAALIAAEELYARRSVEWSFARNHPLDIVDQGADALAALAVGTGLLPVLAAFGLVLIPAGVARTREVVAFRAVLVTSLAGFLLYAGAKGVYGAATFEPRIVERNLIYLVPLVFTAVALFGSSRAINPAAVAVGTVITGYALLTTAYPLETSIYADAPSLSILADIHARWQWDQSSIEVLLGAMIAISVLALLVPHVLRERTAAVVCGIFVALALCWTATAELIASSSTNVFSRTFATGLPKPLSWVDQATAGEPVTYLGQQIANANSVWSLEFWNRSVKRIWSVDGTAPGPGPVLTPNLSSPRGTLSSDPGVPYAIGDYGVLLVGDVVDTKGSMRLYRIEPPLRLEQTTRGVFSDSWVGSESPADVVTARYSRFSTPGDRAGTIDVRVARTGWCPSDPKADIPGRVVIEVGTLVLGPEKNGVLGRVTQRRGWIVRGCGDRTFPIPTPPPPFHVKVSITPTFQPHALDPGNSERRYLGAQLAFDWHAG